MAAQTLLIINKKTIALSVILVALLILQFNSGFSDIYMTCGKINWNKPVQKGPGEMTQKDHLQAVQKKMFGKKSEYEKQQEIWMSKKCLEYRKTDEYLEEHRRYQAYINTRGNKPYRHSRH